MRNSPGLVGAVLALAAASAPVSAQGVTCMRQGQIDPQATQTLQQAMERSDRQLMQSLAGTWYVQIRSPSTGQVSDMYSSYDANGMFSYRNRVCGGGMCSDYAGQGMYGVVGMGGGQFTLMVVVSDQSRNNECSGSYGRFVGDGAIQDSNGNTWQKVQ